MCATMIRILSYPDFYAPQVKERSVMLVPRLLHPPDKGKSVFSDIYAKILFVSVVCFVLWTIL